jgi:8-oxo-dGTP pyrophosphatase MutT (NUDIX family)
MSLVEKCEFENFLFLKFTHDTIANIQQHKDLNMAKKRAGVVPYFVTDTGDIKMLFMKPSNPLYGGPEYQVAKGVVEADEEHHEAALREGYEELGLMRENIKTGCIYPLPGDETNEGFYLHTIKVYAVNVKSTDPELFDEPSYETGDTAWLTLDEYMERGRVLQSHIVKDTHDFVKRMMR